MSEQALTVPEIAEALRVDPETVRRWIQREGLEAVRLPNGEYRVWPSTLEAWIARRRTGAHHEAA